MQGGKSAENKVMQQCMWLSTCQSPSAAVPSVINNKLVQLSSYLLPTGDAYFNRFNITTC